jgi:hypothetical protein
MDLPAPVRVTAWRCIGCGRVEAPQPCIGVCQDRAVDFVEAGDYDAARERVDALASLARRLASSTPRDGEWERSYRALQSEARAVLGDLSAPRTR